MYTKNWFRRNIKNWTNWLTKFKGKPNLRFLEIGCFEGMATVWLLENILTDKSSNITVIDTFEGSREHKVRGLDVSKMMDNFKENTKNYVDRIVINQGFSQEILRTQKFNFYDFIYVDGSHEAPDCLEDMILSLRLLKNGGIMVMDDYLWGKKFPLHFTPKPAIDAFMFIYQEKIEVLSIGKQVALKKI